MFCMKCGLKILSCFVKRGGWGGGGEAEAQILVRFPFNHTFILKTCFDSIHIKLFVQIT